MKPKRMIMIGTMAVAITVGGGIWNKEASAENSLPSLEPSCGAWKSKAAVHSKAAEPDAFLQVLGVTSNDEIYEALYNGQSLSAIAAANQMDVRPIIDLQIAEVTEQLDRRLAAGSITRDVYDAQKLELPDMIVRSVHGELTNK